MNINFNLGNGQAATMALAEICKNYPECKGCPVTKTGAIQIQIDGTMVSCSTEIIRNIQRKAGKNV